METNKIQKYRSVLAILGVLLLIPGFASTQEKSVKLKISVSNTSLEQSQEIDVNINLPKELTKTDIISSDGLQIGYDEGTKGLVAKDKVTLQPAETTFFYVVARDVWLISDEEIRLLRAELDSFRISTSEYYVQQQMVELIKQIDQILAEQKVVVDDTAVHIQAYRKNKQKLDEINDSLLAIRQLHDNKQVQKKGFGFSVNSRFLVNGALLLVLLLSSVLFYRNNKRILQYIHRVQFWFRSGHCR